MGSGFLHPKIFAASVIKEIASKVWLMIRLITWLHNESKALGYRISDSFFMK
jgi:hypothetical protein